MFVFCMFCNGNIAIDETDKKIVEFAFIYEAYRFKIHSILNPF